MSLYDLTLILDPEAPTESRDELLEGIRSAIETEGAIHAEHDWGVRRLAYEIDHHGDGHYHLWQIEAEPALLDRLDRSLKIADGVLRFRLIRVVPGTESSAPAHSESSSRPDEAGDAGDAEAPAQVAARAAADAPPRDEDG
jgi:small subunit ribosomal protein S6